MSRAGTQKDGYTPARLPESVSASNPRAFKPRRVHPLIALRGDASGFGKDKPRSPDALLSMRQDAIRVAEMPERSERESRAPSTARKIAVVRPEGERTASRTKRIRERWQVKNRPHATYLQQPL